jgi:hypothetical protein
MKLIKLLAIASILLITGCSTTVPVTVRFPDAPVLILEKCPQLKTIEGESVSIIDFTKTVTLNYTTYYECAVKSDAWIEWYQKQKKIFEEVQGD